MTFFLTKMLKTPKSYDNDPNGYVKNQLGHSYLVGGIMSFVLFFAIQAISKYFNIHIEPVFINTVVIGIVAILYTIWEAIQLKFYNAKLSDSLEDAAYVIMVSMAFQYGWWLILIPHTLFILSGYFWRKHK